MEEGRGLSREKIVGKQVIDSEGFIIGNVRDVSFDLEERKIVLTVSAKTGPEITILGDDVAQVGDVILLNKTIEPTKPILPPLEIEKPPEPKPVLRGFLCPKCGHLNDTYSSFCILCGTKLR